MVTDLAADVPFAQAMNKLVEHHGVLLSESTIRRMTEGPAQQRLETRELCQGWPQQPGCAAVVAERDGGRVPIMTPDTTREDRRKGKPLSWKEAKICLAHAQGSRILSYGGTLQGDVGTAGRALFDCARRAGFGQATHLHAVGDGAEWIAGQIEEQFGAQSRYLLDFYHVQLDYQTAISRDLPIGSGAIESAHRYLVHQRLKRPGAWWRVEHAEHLLALRLNRANQQWKAYWAGQSQQAA